MKTGDLVWIRVLKGCWQEVFTGDIVLARLCLRPAGVGSRNFYVCTPDWGKERWALYNDLDEPEFEILSPLEHLATAAE